MNKYRMFSTKKLIEEYAWENGRINREDAACTQKLIKAELQRRFNAVIKLLDDPENGENPSGIYRYLLMDFLHFGE